MTGDSACNTPFSPTKILTYTDAPSANAARSVVEKREAMAVSITPLAITASWPTRIGQARAAMWKVWRVDCRCTQDISNLCGGTADNVHRDRMDGGLPITIAIDRYPA